MGSFYEAPGVLADIIVIKMFLIFTTLWFAALLSVFYCVKITSYSHAVFVYVKIKISKLLHLFLLALVVIALGTSLPFGWFPPTIYYMNVSNETVQKGDYMIQKQTFGKNFTFYCTGAVLPSIIFCVAVFLLIKSLLKHTLHMRNTGTSFQTRNVQIHYSVVKSMLSFFLLSIIFHVSVVVSFFEILPFGNPWRIICDIYTCAYPFIHSVVLISSINKLKNSFLQMCHHFMKCFYQ
ncbi:taste receptor type 2 member 9-like [Bombina bombina]|uniref:taste receptor type 2 member 9-like n=1 Tax=Bombina bombina TaxID=8345 RepID=UPI00235AF71B|nr:taste receptor type 2 member 9-like [Bombina bombina]